MTFLKPSLCLHEGGVLVTRVVVSEVRVGCGTLCGGGGSGGGGGGGGLCCCRYSGRFLFREVNGNLDISKRVLFKQNKN